MAKIHLKKRIVVCWVAVFLLTIFTCYSMANAEKFSFRKYRTPETMTYAMRGILPQGTSMSVVEQKLIKEGGAKAETYNRPNYIGYCKSVFPPMDLEWDTWCINILYDKNKNVHQISITGGGDIYPRVPPEDRSDAGIFRFEDYSDAKDLADTMRELFPFGTTKSNVEKVLMKWAMSESYVQSNEPRHVVYSFKNDWALNGNPLKDGHIWNVQFWYSNDNTVVQIAVNGSSIESVFHNDAEKIYGYKVRAIKAQ